MQCGHCTAVCPNGAIEVAGLESDEFTSVLPVKIDQASLLNLLKQRRSIRRYKKKPVPRTVIRGLIEAVHAAPTGTASRSTGVIVIDDTAKLQTLSGLLYDAYEALANNLAHPIKKLFVRQRAGRKRLRTLEEFVLPGMHWYIRWFREGRSNEILRDCPALMLFHSPKNEPVNHENCLIAAYQVQLMAQVMHIGTCINDLIPPMCNRNKRIRALLNLPDNREVYASITMGHPKYTFKKTIPRKLEEVRFI
jgi:nitroreductase